jgi:hypothetical protein
MMIDQTVEVLFAACKKVIEADHLVAFIQQAFAKMRPDKPGPAGN